MNWVCIEIVRVGVTHSVRADALHEATVVSPMRRELAHRMIGWVVDHTMIPTANVVCVDSSQFLTGSGVVGAHGQTQVLVSFMMGSPCNEFYTRAKFGVPSVKPGIVGVCDGYTNLASTVAVRASKFGCHLYGFFAHCSPLV